MRQQLIAELKKGNSAQPDGNAETRSEPDTLQNSALLQLQSQLQSNQVEIANRERDIAALKAKVGDYQARLNQEPVSEQQLADLTRGYDQSKTSYDDLLKKENESKMATSMEQMQQGERFRMLDPPSLPLKPDFPNRLKFCAIGLGVGLMLGLVVVGGLEFLDDRLYTEQALKALLPIKVISEIPRILTPADELRSKRKMLLGWAMAALVFAAILAGSVISYKHS